MALAPSGNATAGDGMKIEGKARSVLFLTFAVFFILGGVTNINDVLIPKLKNLYQLSHFEANLVQFAFFMSYALFSIPAGMLVARIGYVRGFVAGFLVVAAGALLFLPAANSGIYASFLAALFVIGGGITLLQVGQTVVTVLDKNNQAIAYDVTSNAATPGIRLSPNAVTISEFCNETK
mgnify:CR=1 FL=1